MSYWVNIGISEINDMEKLVSKIEDEEMMNIVTEEDGKLLVGTSNVERSVSRSEVEDIIREEDAFNGTKVCILEANDNDDTANGVIYNVSKWELDSVWTEHSGDPGSRREWYGMDLDGLKIGTQMY